MDLLAGIQLAKQLITGLSLMFIHMCILITYIMIMSSVLHCIQRNNEKNSIHPLSGNSGYSSSESNLIRSKGPAGGTGPKETVLI